MEYSELFKSIFLIQKITDLPDRLDFYNKKEK